MLDVQVDGPKQKINYREQAMLIGSCFTEHIGNHLKELKFPVMQNPNGILFDPYSVSTNLVSYIHNKQYKEKDLFFLHELWQSWDHHSIFSKMDRTGCVDAINESQNKAHHFLRDARWLIITLGSSFSYHLLENNRPVANCHRAPAQQFNKHFMTIEEINTCLDNCIHQLFQFNPQIQIVFTVSPVRHIRDGLIDNNRSKARLIEAVHHLANKFDHIHYFPAYELVVDVLRDYRFYDIDMVHPNYAATEFVLDKFALHFIDEESRSIMDEIKKIITARKHKAFQSQTGAHRQFLAAHLEKTRQLQTSHPFLDLAPELAYFSTGLAE
jgi:hypothetical protein